MPLAAFHAQAGPKKTAQKETISFVSTFRLVKGPTDGKTAVAVFVRGVVHNPCLGEDISSYSLPPRVCADRTVLPAFFFSSHGI